MKKILVITAALLVIAAPCRAWYFPSNPDRVPSFGFNYSQNRLNGDVSGLNIQGGDIEHTIGSDVNVDIRVPVHQSATLSFFGDYITNSETVLNVDTNRTGYRVGVGIRIYANEARQ